MSDEDKDTQGNLDLTITPEVEGPQKGSNENTLPPLIPPQTKIPAQFNQQVNINQIPPKAWDRLSPDQIVSLSTKILEQVDRMDERHFTIAKQQALDSGKSSRLGLVVGSLIAAIGLGTVAYLSATGNPVAAAMVGTSLATLVAVVIGGKIAS